MIRREYQSICFMAVQENLEMALKLPTRRMLFQLENIKGEAGRLRIAWIVLGKI